MIGHPKVSIAMTVRLVLLRGLSSMFTKPAKQEQISSLPKVVKQVVIQATLQRAYSSQHVQTSVNNTIRP